MRILTLKRCFSDKMRDIKRPISGSDEIGTVNCQFLTGRFTFYISLALLFLAGCKGTPTVDTTSAWFPNEGKTGHQARKNADRAFRTAREQVDSIIDVSADLVRQELVGRRLQDPETIRWRQRVKPRSLHLTWIGKRLKGRQVVYVEGANDGKMLVLLDGFKGKMLGVQRFSPTGRLATWGSRYPVTVVGYDALVRRIVENYEKAAKRGTLGVVDFGQQSLPDLQTYAFEVVLDHPESQGGDYHRMIVWFDVQSGLPVRFIGLDVRDHLLEDYFWQRLAINQNLVDADFVIGKETPAPPEEVLSDLKGEVESR